MNHNQRKQIGGVAIFSGSAFKRPQLEDRQEILSFLDGQKYRGCERTFANIYLWARFYDLKWARVEDTLVFRMNADGRYSYTYPAGDGDRKAAVEQIMQECREAGCPVRIHGMSKLSAGENLTAAREIRKRTRRCAWR